MKQKPVLLQVPEKPLVSADFIRCYKAAVLLELLEQKLLTRQEYDQCLDRLDRRQ